MLRKLLHSVALVVLMSAPGLADIHQNQGFSVGINAAIDLLGSLTTASNNEFLAVQLAQTATQGAELLATGGNSAFGQQSQSFTSGTSLIAGSFKSIAGGFQVPSFAITPVSGGQFSLFSSLPLLIGN